MCKISSNSVSIKLLPVKVHIDNDKFGVQGQSQIHYIPCLQNQCIRRGVQKLYYNYTFMTRVEEMWTKFQTFKRYGNVYQPFVIKWDPESCKSKALLLEKPSVNNVGMMLLQTIVKDESGCHPCPMLVDIF